MRAQAERVEACFERFAREAFGSSRPAQLKRATFVLAEVPIAAVKGYLERREAPPPLADELIEKTYRAIVGNSRG